MVVSIRDIGSMIRWMERDSSFGLLEKVIKVHIKRISKMVLVS